MSSQLSECHEFFSTDATLSNIEKIETGRRKTGLPGASDRGGVALISKPNTSCRAAEKTPASPLPSERDVIADCDRLSRMELRGRYKAEANSHRNMLHRQATAGAVVHPAFKDFVSFLRHVGPIPAVGATLDRIDNDDPEYAPGKVRWADKRTQNSNKGDSLTFHDPKTGEIFTTSRLAKKQGVSPGTIRKRLERGWSDAEIIEGRRPERLPVPARCPTSPAPHFCPPPSAQPSRPRPRTAAEIQFERTAELFRWVREEHGEEYLPAPIDVLNEGLPPHVTPVTQENYDRHFAHKWPRLKPHLIFERARPYHQAVIARIDPEYVEQQMAKAALKATLREVL